MIKKKHLILCFLLSSKLTKGRAQCCVQVHPVRAETLNVDPDTFFFMQYMEEGENTCFSHCLAIPLKGLNNVKRMRI